MRRTSLSPFLASCCKHSNMCKNSRTTTSITKRIPPTPPTSAINIIPKLQPKTLVPVKPSTNLLIPAQQLLSSTATRGLSCYLKLPPSYLTQTRHITTASTPYPGVSLYSIKKCLVKLNILYTESHPCICITIPAFTFGEPVSTQWARLDDNLCKVFINKVTGSWLCPELCVRGSWPELETLLSVWVKNKRMKKMDAKLSYPHISRTNLDLPENVRQVWDRGVGLERLSPVQFRELLLNFKLKRGSFEADHFSKFEVRVSQDLSEMYFPVKYITGSVVGLKRLTVEDNCLVEDSLPANGGVMPFIHNLSTAWAIKTTQCVLVGSVLDSVVLSARTSMTVICLSDWTSLPPDLLAYMDQFTSITIWLGCGVQGVETANSFSKKLGDHRCKVVTNEWPSALQAVRKKLDVSDILASASTQHHQYITTFDSLRHDVFLEFLQSDQMEGVKWKRFDGLNSLMKGFRRGEMTVFTGRTGSGKTTFMSEYSLDLCMQGVSTLWGSFEVKNVRLVRMMLKQFGLVNLDENLEEFDKVAEKFQKLPLFFTTFHGTQEVELVLDAMAHAVYVHDIAHVIIDNIQFMVGSNGGHMDRFTKQDQCIEMFRKFATLHNVHVTLVIHPRKDMEEKLTVHSIFGGGKATQEADNVMLLQEESVEESFLKNKSIEVVKNRYAGDLGVMPLFFTKPVLSFSKKIAESVKKPGSRSRKKILKILTPDGGEVEEEILIKPEE